MKKNILLITMIFITIYASAQLNVTSLKPLPRDLTAKIYPEIDRNNKTCALIRITTPKMDQATREKLIFKGDAGTEIVKTTFPTGEAWIYLSPQARYLEIKHPDLGVEKYEIPIDIESAVTYEMILESTKGEVLKYNYLVINATPKEARIYVNDELLGIGEIFKLLNVGVDHEYRVECDLYHTASGKVQTNPNKKTTLDINLEPAFGFLSIDTKPEQGAEILINGKHAGVTPYVSEKLASGLYEVQVLKNMYKTATKSIRVIDNETTEYVFDMASNFAELQFKTDPEAQLFIDGQLKGIGKWSGRLDAGSHLVEARKEFHRTTRETITIKQNQTGEIIIESPEPIYGKINIQSKPIGATIFIDGKEYGTTPDIITDVLIGVHTISLEKIRCASVSTKVTLEEGKITDVSLELPTGKELNITSDPSGAKVYIDDNYLGDTPLTKIIGFGEHSLKLTIGNESKTEIIEVTKNSNKDYFFDLITGKEITIKSHPDKAKLFIDNKHVGETPYKKKLGYGTHNIYVEKGDMAQTKTITVSKESSDIFLIDGFRRVYKPESFLTLNGAYSIAPQWSFGLTYGHLKSFGWFISLMSGTDFKGFSTEMTSDSEDGQVDGELPFYSGETSNIRFSVIAGGLMKLENNIVLRLGLGYGIDKLSWKTTDEQWVDMQKYSVTGLEISAGLHYSIKNFVVSFDLVSTQFKNAEVKLGLGIKLNNKKVISNSVK